MTSLMTGFLSLVTLMLLARAIFGVQMAGSWVDARGRVRLRRLRAHPDGTARRKHRARHPDRTGDCQSPVLSADVPVGFGDAVCLAARRRQTLRAFPADDLSGRHLLERHRARRGIDVASQGRSPCCSASAWSASCLTSMLFRWEGTDPIPRRSLAHRSRWRLRRRSAWRRLPRPRSGWASCRARGASSLAPPRGQVRVLRGATVLDGLGGRIVKARVVDPRSPHRRCVARRRARAAA